MNIVQFFDSDQSQDQSFIEPEGDAVTNYNDYYTDNDPLEMLQVTNNADNSIYDVDNYQPEENMTDEDPNADRSKQRFRVTDNTCAICHEVSTYFSNNRFFLVWVLDTIISFTVVLLDIRMPGR